LENFNFDRHGHIKTALNELGFTIDFIEKQDQKTIITVSHYEKGDRSPVSTEEQRVIGYETQSGVTQR